jgi:hypothetical protein
MTRTAAGTGHGAGIAWASPRRWALAALACVVLSPPAGAAPGDTQLVSRHPASGVAFGAELDQGFSSAQHSVSSWARFVLMRADGGSLFPGDEPGVIDLLLYDRTTGVWEKIDVATDGTHAGGTNSGSVMSSNARFVAWHTNSAILGGDAVLRDRRAGTTEVIGGGSPLAVSNDGRRVLFVDLELYLRDRQSGATTLVSTCYRGANLSGDGRYLVFDACGRLILRDLATGQDKLIDTAPYEGFFLDAYLSLDGRYLVYSKGGGEQVEPMDPRKLYFFDRVTGVHELVSVNDAGQPIPREAWRGVVTDDGRYVSFHSYGGTLNDGYQGGVFVRDRQTGTTRRGSVDSFGGGTACCSIFGAISPDGRYVFFAATDPMASVDTNRNYDVYMHELGAAVRTPVVSFAVSPQAMDFGNLALGTKTSKKFWVRNTGKSGLYVQDWHMIGRDTALITSSSSGRTYLYPGDSTPIRVTVNAATPGTKQATLVVTAGIDTVKSRPVTANVIDPVNGAYTLSRTVADFGNVPRLTVKSLGLTIRNTGTTALPVLTITLGGVHPTEFGWASKCPGTSIPVGGTCGVTLKFAPNRTGAKSATLSIAFGAGAPVGTVQLKGTGT